MRDSAVTRALADSRLWLVAGLIAVGITCAVVWRVVALRHAASPQRVEMYQRALANVRESCEPLRPELESQCREQAALLLEFPECDADCAALVHRVRREPRR